MRELLRFAAFPRHDVKFQRRSCKRVAWVRQITPTIEPYVHPVVHAALESLGELLFLSVLIVAFSSGRSLFRERDPTIVRTEDRCPADAGNLEGLAARTVHP